MNTLNLNASKKTKQTPAGEIPVDWGWSELTKVAKIQTGLSKSSSRQGDFIRLPYLRVANVQDGHFNLSEIKKIDVPKDSVERYSIKKGDVLLTEGGDYDKLGRGAIWQGQISPCVHQNHIFVVRPNEELLDTRFFAYQSSGPRGRAYFQSCAKQSTNLASINSSQLKEFPAFLPPLPEQKKIADILGTWDTALEKLDALIAAKTRRKQALMQQLLTGKKRLPGFSGEWKSTKLGDILEFQPRTTPKPASPFLSAGIRSHGKGVFLKPNFNPDAIALTELFEIKTGDLIVNITFAWEGAFAIVSEDANGALTSHRFLTFTCLHHRATTNFLRHAILTKKFKFECGLASPGGAGRNRVLSKKAFLKISLKLPSFGEQSAIAQVLDTADAEINLLKKQRIALDQQKRGLMQQLLTGKVRVKV